MVVLEHLTKEIYLMSDYIKIQEKMVWMYASYQS